MADDFQQLEQAEQKLLDAVKAASEVTAKLSSGETDGLEELCAKFLDNIQESQTALVQLAAKYSEPLPYENSDTDAKLELEAAQQRLEAAELQLRHLQQQQQQQVHQQAGADQTGGTAAGGTAAGG